MKRAISVFAPVVLAFAAAHAAHADAPVTTEARTVSGFHAIDVAGVLAVEVTVGKPARVEVRGEADLIAKVTTAVSDGVLVLDTKVKSFHHRNHLRVFVDVPSLDALTVSGTGDLKVAGVAANRFALSVPGTGQIKIAGETKQLDIKIDGTGNLEAKSFASKDASIDVRGTGSATLRATESVQINVTGTGSVEVVGNPARVKKSVTGVGAIDVH